MAFLDALEMRRLLDHAPMQDAEREYSDDVHEIGFRPKRETVTLTMVESASEGTLVYGNEHPVRAVLAQECELRLERHPASLDCPRWRGIELSTNVPALRSSEVVVTAYPYSSDWLDEARFKPSGFKHHTKAELEMYKREAIEDPEGARAYLRRLSFDVFETRSRLWTARLDWPHRTGDAVTTGRRSGTLAGATQAGWLFGVCADAAGCRVHLRNTELLQRVLAETEDGTLFSQYYLGARQGMHQLEEDAITLRHAALEASIAKALAGMPPRRDACAPLLGRGRVETDVAVVAAEIYVRTMYDLNRRIRWAGTTDADGAAEGGEATAEDRDEDALSALLDEIDPEVVRNVASSLLDSAEPEARLRACWLARLPDESLTGRLRKRTETDPDARVREAARAALDVFTSTPRG